MPTLVFEVTNLAAPAYSIEQQQLQQSLHVRLRPHHSQQQPQPRYSAEEYPELIEAQESWRRYEAAPAQASTRMFCEQEAAAMAENKRRQDEIDASIAFDLGRAAQQILLVRQQQAAAIQQQQAEARERQQAEIEELERESFLFCIKMQEKPEWNGVPIWDSPFPAPPIPESD